MVSAYDILLVYNQTSKVGLLDNMVYDVIPPVAGAIGNATVNASIYHVQCSALPDLTDSTEIGFFELMDGSNATIMLALPYYPAVSSGSISNIFGHNDTDSGCSQSTCWAPLIFASTISIVDSSGSESPTSTGSPWWRNKLLYIDANDVVITASQLVACEVKIRDKLLTISAKELQPFAPPPQATAAVWTNFSWPDTLAISDPRILAAQNTPLLSPASGHQEPMELTQLVDMSSGAKPEARAPFTFDQYSSARYEVTESKSSNTLSAFESFLLADLGVTSGNHTSIGLADLNRSIGKALAAVQWYGQRIGYSMSQTQGDSIQQSLPLALNASPCFVDAAMDQMSEYGETNLTVMVTRYQLDLSLIPLLTSTTSSALLLLVAAGLTAPSILFVDKGVKTRRTAIGSAGVLQVMWLLGIEPRLADVDTPEVSKLRRAGMFSFQRRKRG
ncbi:hypothetical protein PsYK624_159640 [Phanerochaete sordida]|uniref:Uncharacterized protein n=1 Tax=Phanerochaete sordida TaxID=48140 RepID=A0A9P3GPX0_9APHY|nr:hypothetical protein PsYK624_159640 [Phanerochaete sordida]